MNHESLREYSAEFQSEGLYKGAFCTLAVSTHRQIDYANNVLLVSADHKTIDEVLLIYAALSEALHCLYWTPEQAIKFIENASIKSFPLEDFVSLYKTHFRGNSIFNRINPNEIEGIWSFSEPPYDDWSGELFIQTKYEKYVLMWDYGD